MSREIKPIAIYLPQFHPISENDSWWGKGFTEWTNVVKSKPRFEGHYQPHLPADLGFYDLRLKESRLQQEQIAKEFGIHGFCYYHYWFNGKRLLYEPLDRKLKNADEDLPFMMCWANENWTRTWDGAENKILLSQEYSFEDDLNHIQHLISYFKDDRYIKVDGKPVFIIYRPKFFPNIEETIKIWRDEVKKAGFPDLYIGFSQNHEHDYHPKSKGFDFAFQFQPDFQTRSKKNVFNMSVLKRIKRRLMKYMGLKLEKDQYHYDYFEYVQKQIELNFSKDVYPGITPMWDNSARRKIDPFILHNSTPEKYKYWLSHIKNNYTWEEMPESFLFINAWNEWAEGNHLEPCEKWSRSYLEATKEILN